ncbi:hypothetical protein ACWEWL_06830 [Streptomyces rochei]
MTAPGAFFAPGVCVGAGVGVAARRYGVPLRPPVPPQRHDCPQLGGMTARSGGCCGGVARQGGGHRAPCAPRAYG